MGKDMRGATAERTRGRVRLVRPRFESGASDRPVESAFTERVAELLTQHEAMASDVLARRLSAEPARVQLELQELEALGLVVRTPGGWLLA